MSAYAANLGRAARLLKRLSNVIGPDEFEGVKVKEIIGDVLMAQNRAYMENALERFQCDIDESAGMAEVHEIHGHSKRVPCA